MRNALLVAALAFVSCSARTVTPPPPEVTGADAGAVEASCGCAQWTAPVDVGPIGEPALVELSGLAASRAHPGVLYAHNDSGDTARFFALSTAGNALGEFQLSGATAIDWEDLAVGPCGGPSCVYLGDIGDNLRRRTDYAVYRVAEPDVEASAPVGVVVLPAFERLAFAYPLGEKNNAETLLVHPVTGRLYVATKEPTGQPSRLFRFPAAPSTTAPSELELVGTLPVPTPTDAQLTAGAVSPCGDRLLLRMYNRLVELTVPAGQPFEAVLGATPVTVPSATEDQGEAVAWSADGRGYFTSSEVVVHPARLSQVGCR